MSTSATIRLPHTQQVLVQTDGMPTHILPVLAKIYKDGNVSADGFIQEYLNTYSDQVRDGVRERITTDIHSYLDHGGDWEYDIDLSGQLTVSCYELWVDRCEGVSPYIYIDRLMDEYKQENKEIISLSIQQLSNSGVTLVFESNR
ncbi:hypothetical protein [Vibrio sp. D431a]|uniref:hypothetical protein n=1 Tax=Vibrio sp. D431a TaxID=2837388 RepID=UPI00255336C3|nr:hypothetical protein [Vibrio sp. D431a]MDK9793725.1 hypothetical protein [Vibrio sp. D431a]